MSPLPASRSAIDAVGKRLAAGRATLEDEALYGRLLEAYGEVLEVVQQTLADAGLESTGRLKTSSTLLDKVSRGSSLKSVQDIAGCRIVIDGDRWDQERVVERVEAALKPLGCTRRIDRIEKPQHGYRAIYVVAMVDGLSVEVQVRTQWQDKWAQVVEALGDLWGRELRYTGQPLDPDLPFKPGSEATRRDVVELCQELSRILDDLEMEITFVRLCGEPVSKDDELPTRVRELADRLRPTLEESRAAAEKALGRLFNLVQMSQEEAT